MNTGNFLALGVWGVLLGSLSGCPTLQGKGVILSQNADVAKSTSAPAPSPSSTPSPVPSLAPSPLPTGNGTVHLITPGTDGHVFVSGSPLGSPFSYFTAVPNLKCGDTIAFQAGTYRGISLENIQGCAGNPIIVTNQGGQVVIDGQGNYTENWGLDTGELNHVVIRSATPGTYGFKIMNNQRAGVLIARSSNDVDVSGINTVDMNYGFVVKTDPKCDTTNNGTQWLTPDLNGKTHVISNIRIHDNKIDGGASTTDMEGMYLGYETENGETINCPAYKNADGTTNPGTGGVNKMVYAERLSRVEVDHNLLVNTGNDAIKLRLCQDGCDIHDNVISGYGVLRTSDSAWCFGITIGDLVWGNIYNNVIDHGYCSAIYVLTNDATHPLNIYGNTTSYAGTLPNGTKGASWAGGIAYISKANGQTFNIHDNLSSHHAGADIEVDEGASSASPSTPYSFSGTICNDGPVLKYNALASSYNGPYSKGNSPSPMLSVCPTP